MKNLASIAYSDERLFYYQPSQQHLYLTHTLTMHFSGWKNVLFELGNDRVKFEIWRHYQLLGFDKPTVEDFDHPT